MMKGGSPVDKKNNLLYKLKQRHHGFYNVGSVVLSSIAGLLAIILIFYSSYVLFDTFYINHIAMSSTDLMQYKPKITQTVETIDDKPVPMADSPETTKSILGEDYVAWLTMPDTHIDYPVMQGDNDLEYAYKNIYGKNAVSGSIYLATDNTHDMSDTYNIFYGHHMDNGAMFGDLDKYVDEQFFNSHRNGYLIVDNTIYDLTTVAVMYTDAYEGMIYYVSDQLPSRIQAQKNYIANHAMYLDRELLQNAPKLLTLSTCAGATTDGRLILVTSMTVRTEPLPIEDIPDTPVPKHFPTIYEDAGAWALLNLLILCITIYLAFPLFRLSHKFGRKKLIGKINPYFMPDNRVSEKSLARKQRIALILEICLSVLALLLFLLTENLSLSITLIDKWTIWMLVILVAVWVVDVWLWRWRQRSDEFVNYDVSTFKNKLQELLDGESNE